MELRRLLLFSVTTFAIWIGWALLGPRLFPGLFPVPLPPAAEPVETADARQLPDAGIKAATEPGDAQAGQPAGAEGRPEVVLSDFPVVSVTLGSSDPQTGYALQVELTSVGASIRRATLNDPRYVEAENFLGLTPWPQLMLLGNNLAMNSAIKPLDRLRPSLTVDTAVEGFDDLLADVDPRASARTISWKVETQADELLPDVLAGAKFTLPSPDGSLELVKTYRLNRLEPAQAEQPLAQADLSATPYLLDVSVEVRNTGSKVQQLAYTMQGPVGLPLENVESARKLRDIKAGFISEAGDLTTATMTSKQVADAVEDDEVEEWSRPLRYIGVDVQYFAALIVPKTDQIKRQSFESTHATVERRDTDEPQLSDISVLFQSPLLEIAPGKSSVDEFQVFLGPKRREVLDDFGAESIIDYGWFGWISNGMVSLLVMFHAWGAPYGAAIILLTVIVRGCMFPISRRQVASSRKMKELQPLLQELKDKYKDDKQKLAQAQMELYRKANFNPFAGCLPVFLQLPIFLALYQALSNHVDLRMASFLWIDNLAAPDRLFEMPFALPFLGSSFNLLPLITMVLFYVQQKMFMPPPTNDEMAMQQKMMSYMMIFFGFLFYKVPAGLCVYFIASSGWSMAERKLLELLPEKPRKEQKPRKEGFIAKLAKQMQEAAEMQKRLEGDGDGSRPNKRGR